MKRMMPFCSLLVLFVPLFLVMFPLGALAQNAKYVGSDACKSCHEDAFKSYTGSIHGKAYVPGSPSKREGCESCHGPGSVHVDKGGGKDTIVTKGKKMAANCQSCHQDSKSLAFWDMGKHKRADVNCNDCHASHAMGKKNLKAPEPQLCYACHKDIRSQAVRQSRHPINEGKVLCRDCHSPHGSFGKAMIKADSNNELCYKCHADKRGPFLHEHAPVEENCLNCHHAHGSSHNSLLVKRLPLLCTACHAGRHPSTLYGKDKMFTGQTPSVVAVGRSCTNCHYNIHGSNGAGQFGAFFAR